MLPSSRRSTWAKAPAVAPGAAGRPGQTPLRRDVFTDIPSAANRRTPDLVPRRLGLAAKPLDAQQRQAALEAVRTGATLPARGGAAAPTRSVFAARPTTVTVATEVGRYLPAKRDEPAAAAVRTSSPPRLSTAPPRHERENDAEQVEGRAALLRAPRSRAPPPQRACEVWLASNLED
ncbi:hypothetical protein M885DRAFT_499659 [Pelagophyceae sp. CCMP2097]|nr:hypothetical protein M885DRAFT_499659 [Pelagophyceae sp. CCMP2097]